jgi:plastocyanin
MWVRGRGGLCGWPELSRFGDAVLALGVAVQSEREVIGLHAATSLTLSRSTFYYNYAWRTREEQMAQTHQIDINTMAFPANTAVAKGDTVVWTNKMPMQHTVTSDATPPLFDSGELGQDDTFQYTFNDAGPFPYHCEIHPTRMKGTVTVG